MKTNKRMTLALAALLLPLVACGGTAPTPKAAPVASRCIPASSGQLEAIRVGVKGVASYNDVQAGWAVRSKDFDRVWFVAAKITGPNTEQAGPGVWAISGDPSQPGLTLAVNGMAQAFTDYPDASKTQAEITMSSDGAREAETCAR